MTQWREEERIHQHGAAELHAPLDQQQSNRIFEEAVGVYRDVRRVSLSEESDDGGGHQESPLWYRHDVSGLSVSTRTSSEAKVQRKGNTETEGETTNDGDSD
jgi:hypothetical protein